MADGTRYIEEWSNGLLISHAKVEGDSSHKTRENLATHTLAARAQTMKKTLQEKVSQRQ